MNSCAGAPSYGVMIPCVRRLPLGRAAQLRANGGIAAGRGRRRTDEPSWGCARKRKLARPWDLTAAQYAARHVRPGPWFTRRPGRAQVRPKPCPFSDHQRCVRSWTGSESRMFRAFREISGEKVVPSISAWASSSARPWARGVCGHEKTHVLPPIHSEPNKQYGGSCCGHSVAFGGAHVWRCTQAEPYGQNGGSAPSQMVAPGGMQ